MSLRLKTILGVGIIEAILLIILISTALSHMRSAGRESLENYAQTTSTLFQTMTKDALLSFDIASLDSLVNEILINKDILYVRIYDSENTVLSSGGITELLKNQYTIDKSINDVNDDIFNIEKKITVDGEYYGRIEIGISTKIISQSLSETKKLVGLIALIEMFLVAMFSFALGTYLTRQLNTLRRSAKNIAKGDLNQKIPIISNDEIAEVSIAFNKMTSSLQQAEYKRDEYQKELLLINEELEARVNRRTQQLSTKNNELENAYNELQETQKQLIHAEKLASIGQLAAGVAHEINNPIAFIKSNLSALIHYVNIYTTAIVHFKETNTLIINNETTEAIERAQEALSYYETEDIDFINEDLVALVNESVKGVDRVKDIVQGLKIYSGNIDEHWTETSINQCIEHALTAISKQQQYSDITIETALNTLPIIQCDPEKITQALTNLTINAAQAIIPPGTITIASHADDRYITIVLTDTGKGISPNDIGRLFDPFFTTKAVGEGTGLGLSISEGIIIDHQGTINVTSELGQGSVFTIQLPIAR